MNERPDPFSTPAVAEAYALNTLRKVPGLADLHRMTTLLLAEQAPEQAHILVVGAGGGLELRAMATARPEWRFTGVDPSPVMLNQARQVTAPFAARVHLVEGKVDRAPMGRFDGATCLLTLHFLDRTERLHTLQAVRTRLRPGAQFVLAHHAPPSGDPARWLARSAVFGAHTGDALDAADAGRMMARRLPLLSPAEEEGLLRDAGFSDVALFYAALSFRGWIATA